MSVSVLTIRPEPGCAATIAAGRALGLAVEGRPLFEIAPLPWDAPDASLFDALLIGSANAMRHGGADLALYRNLPVYAVGDATAAAVREAGFAVAMAGEGELQGLIDRIDRPLRLLRLAGEEHVPVRLPAGITVEVRAVYTARPLALPPALAAKLKGTIVLAHSAAAARHFAAECDRLSVAREDVSIAALGPRIAAAAGSGWRRVISARQPSEAALLALASDMCHDVAP